MSNQENMTEKQIASVVKTYVVTHKNLPLSCPMPEMRLWDAHPKVFLPIEAAGQAICPYCNARYILKEE